MGLCITLYGETVLRKKGAPVEKFDKALRKFAADMVEAMHEGDGVGLAAQQAGHALQLFVIDLTGYDKDRDIPYVLDGRRPPFDVLMPMVFINARISPMKGDYVSADEGCLSFPDIRGDVTRPDRIRCEFQDIDGARHVLEAGGWLSRVVQHEFDHTQGVLFIDRMDEPVRKSIDSRLRRLRRSTKAAGAARNEAVH
jgi:peptide deformylase